MDAIHYENYRQVEKRYKKLADKDTHIEWFFSSFCKLVQKPDNCKMTWDVLIAYLFIKVEQAHRMALYATMVKKYKINKVLAADIAGNSELRLDRFRAQYTELIGKALCEDSIEYYDNAVDIRNKVIHGKGLVHGRGILFADKVNEQQKRDAVIWILEYAVLFNEQTKEIFVNKKFNEKPEYKHKPFGTMVGFNGNAETDNWEKSMGTIKELKLLKPKELDKLKCPIK